MSISSSVSFTPPSVAACPSPFQNPLRLPGYAGIGGVDGENNPHLIPPLASTGRFEEAVREFREALRINPGDERARIALEQLAAQSQLQLRRAGDSLVTVNIAGLTLRLRALASLRFVFFSSPPGSGSRRGRFDAAAANAATPKLLPLDETRMRDSRPAAPA